MASLPSSLSRVVLQPNNIFSWNKKLVKYVKAGQFEKTLELFRRIQQQEGMTPDGFTFVPVLNACASLRALEDGRLVHEQVIQSGCVSDVFVGNSLVDMYSKCGKMEDAWQVFNKMPTHDVVSWNTVILGHGKCGEGHKALQLFQQMKGEGVLPDSVTFVGVLNACASVGALEHGRRVHEQIIQNGCQLGVFVGSSLVDMYAKCGSIEDAWRVFNQMTVRNVVTWTAMIQGHVKCGKGWKALELFQQMQQEGLQPDAGTFVRVLNACASVTALEEGRRVHKQILHSGCESDAFVSSSLVDMYAKCGSMEDAWRVFHKIPTHNVVSWTAMILGLVKCGQGERALELFHQMQQQGVQPDPVTFVAVLNACASAMLLDNGRHIHEHIIANGCESNVFVGNSLVDMYVKCGSMEDAWRVFNKMPSRDVVSWTAMILGHLKCGQAQKALALFQQMWQDGVQPVPVTFVGALNACAITEALEEGRHIHKQVIEGGCESDVFVSSSLVNMYAKCGSMEEAWKVFNKMPSHNVASWTAMILGHVKCGQGEEALELFGEMQQEGFQPNPFTFVGVLNACASLQALEKGRLVHEQIVQSGFESHVFVGNSLVNMYAKLGSIEDAWRAFNKMTSCDVVSWTAMIMALVKCGLGQKALELFRQMQHEGVHPDPITFIGVLNACASVAALDEGRRVHKQIADSSYESDVFVGSSLVDMYAKCGSIEDAWTVFNKLPTRDVVSWNAMLGGFAMHGHGKEALAHFEHMCVEGIKMNGITFVCLLSACSRAGLVDEGLVYFDSMSSIYGISATAEHYACIIDLLGHAGCLHEAEDLIHTMSCTPSASVWKALLGACRIHGNVEMAERVATQVVEVDPRNAAGNVLLSNIYAASGKWELLPNVQ